MGWTMRNKQINSLAVWLTCLAILAGAGGSAAQSRKGLTLSAPGGSFRGVGERSFVSRVFSPYSYGLGSLQSSAGGAGGGVLRSSVAGAASFSIRRSSAGGTGLSARLGPGAAARQLYTPQAGGITDQGGGGAGQLLAGQDNAALGAALAYMQAVSSSAAATLKKQIEPITSLSPSEPSIYTTHMVSGEKAFYAGEFIRAFDEFQLANDLTGRDPESLLSMAHSRFALSRNSYARAAYYLQQAIKYLPELPLVPLQPRGFYGDATTYLKHLIRLEEHTDKFHTDAEAYLVLGYYRWFDEDTEAAGEAMRKSFAAARSPELAEAIETFWDGMVASGRISGELQPPAATQPAATQPAATEVPAPAEPANPGVDAK